MSKNLETLIAAAAELRAGGYSWESIAEKLRRPLKTCQNWPNKQARLWAEYFRPAQLRLWEQMVMEARTRLHAFMRDEDKKLSYKANELIMKHSAAAYGPAGTVTCPEPGPAKPHEGNAEIHARLSRVLDEARTEIDHKRAKAGQPPVSNADFMEAWQKELDSRPPKREPIKVYFDKEGNAIDPPGEGTTPADAKFDSHNVLIPPEVAKPAGGGGSAPPGPGPAAYSGPVRDVVWGVLLLAAFITGRSGSAEVVSGSAAPEGRPIVARGEAKRNPWTWPAFLEESSPGGAQDSVAPPGLKPNGIGVADSRGSAALHPWLLSVAPPGLQSPPPVPNEPPLTPFVERDIHLRVQVVKAVGAAVAGQQVQLVVVGPADEPVAASPALVRVVGRHRVQPAGPVAAVENVVAQPASEGAVAVDAVEAVVPIGEKWAGDDGPGPRGPPLR